MSARPRKTRSSRAAADAEDEALEVVRVRPPKTLARHRRRSTIDHAAHTSHKSSHSGSASTAKKSVPKGRRQEQADQNQAVEDEEDVGSDRGEASAESDIGQPANRAGRKRARHRAQTGDSGSETEEEQEQRQVSKKRREEHQLDVGRAVPLVRPVPPSNQTAPPQQPQQAAPAPPQQSQPPAPSPAAPAPPAAPAVCTPYTRRTNPAKKGETLESSYSPASKTAVQALKWPANTYVATQNPFFEKDDINTFLEPLLLELLRKGDAGAKNRIARQSDPFYIPDILRHVRGEASKIRNHTLNVARNIVKEHYELVFRKPPANPETVTERLNRVRELLNQSKFSALDTNTGLGLFEHPAVHDLIYRAFFDSNAPKFNLAIDERCADAFKMYPNALIAFSAAMIYAALSEWSSGTLKTTKFNARQYSGTCQGLLEALKRVTTGEEESRAFDAKRAAWYKAAITRAGYRPTFDLGDDMDDVIRRSRAALRTQAQALSDAAAAGAGVGAQAGGNADAQSSNAGPQNGGPN